MRILSWVLVAVALASTIVLLVIGMTLYTQLQSFEHLPEYDIVAGFSMILGGVLWMCGEIVFYMSTRIFETPSERFVRLTERKLRRMPKESREAFMAETHHLLKEASERKYAGSKDC